MTHSLNLEYHTERNGSLRLSFTDDSDWRLFNKIAKRIVKRFNGKIIEKLDGLEQRYWDIKIADKIITLHLEHYLGIMLLSKSKENDQLVKEIGQYIERNINNNSLIDNLLDKIFSN